MPRPLLLRLYSIATAVASLAMPLWLQRRVSIGKESPERWRERFGQTTTARPPGQVIWCHAASVGETTSVLPLVKALAARGRAIVLTTGTVTSERLVRDQLPSNVVHQFAPLDHGPWLDRFLDHWQPTLALRVDSELWPNTLLTLHQRQIPIVQINARLSDAAANRWAQFSSFAQSIFSTLDLVLAQSEADRARYERLGAPRTAARGNLKLSQPDLPFDAREYESLVQTLAGRLLWLAASIHPGEDSVVGTAHRALLSRHPKALMIVVPRHPERAPEMTQTLRTMGLSVATRSTREPITPDTHVYMADTMGELGLFYRLSKIVFMGKTFTVGGGQNPAEPAQLGCALMWGPAMSNFASLAADLESQGAALAVPSPAQLADMLSALLSDPARIAAMAQAGQAYISASHGALERVLDDLAPYLNRAAIR